MNLPVDKYRDDLERLESFALALLINMGYDLDILDAKDKKRFAKVRLTDFKSTYESWYSESLCLIKQILPDRLDDFAKLYKNEKRKKIDRSTYTMSDYLSNVTIRIGGQERVGPIDAFSKLETQKGIVEAAARVFESTLFDIHGVLQASIFDREIDSARELVKNGYYRAGGAVAGVVLEKHLSQVCTAHGIAAAKKTPTLSDYNDALKASNTIDVPDWRFIQHLADIRNLCVHKKTAEPTKEQVESLVSGVEKVCKTVH